MGKHQFGWKLKYEENFKTDLSAKLFIEFTTAVIKEELQWDIVYTDEISIEAKAMSKSSFVKADPNYLGEKIVITINETGRINVLSRSINVPGMWDMGRNHNWVTDFIIHFKRILKKLTEEQINVIKESIKERESKEIYIVPATLPPPSRTRIPSPYIPIIGGAAIALILASILAIIPSIIFGDILWGLMAGIVFAYAFEKIITLSNYSEIMILKIVGAGSILLLFSLNQYFQYLIFINEHILTKFSFMDFIRLRLEQGFTSQRGDLTTNYGSIGLIFSWIVQMGFTYMILLYRMIPAVLISQVGKIPAEVTDFILNYLDEGKSEDYTRAELKTRGWTEKVDQELAFKAADAAILAQQIIRQG